MAFGSLVGTSVLAEQLNLPPRATNAPGGAELIQRLAPLSLAARETELMTQVLAGNVPGFLRKLCPVQVTSVTATETNTATFFVTPDYLAIGSDEDYFLAPLSPATAQQIADALKCSLPTRKMVDAVYRTAEIKLVPEPISPSPAMTTIAVFGRHNSLVRTQLTTALAGRPLGSLVAGHKKDVVISAMLPHAPGKVAIYGWHQTNGKAIQPLYLGHSAEWVDYSQCTRLVLQQVMVNGEPRTLAEVLADPKDSVLLSDEGPLKTSRYPTNLPGLKASSSTQTDAAKPVAAWKATGAFGERTATLALPGEVQITINSPREEEFRQGKKVLLVYYALPNGNTTEQTIGKVPRPGDDWHYDIQHIGAQTRFLRGMLTNQVVVVAYLANSLQGWPAWRKQNGDRGIPALFAAVKNQFPGQTTETVLTGHSGGGSLIFGYLNTLEHIPNDVVRIAFLDSNYAYDKSLGHTGKLAEWLKSETPHFLCVLAYNDAIALLEGKSFVSAQGGTWGRSHKMELDLAEIFQFERRADAEFERFTALSGRIQFLLKENPERKILHTVQVERNGFIHALVTGTPNENRGYEYYGERAYARWIQE